MIISNKTITIALSAALMLSGCGSKEASTPTPTPDSKKALTINDIKIEPLPSKFSKYSAKGYNRYVAVKAPNGKPINILIMDRLTNYQIVKAVNVLNHYLTPLKNSAYGSKVDKDTIANSMADNNATLKLMNYRDEPKYNDDLPGQPLFEEEIQVEGGEWYMAQDYKHRDASYEEILHLVHDYGIGVSNSGSGVTGSAALMGKINVKQISAYNNKTWTPDKSTYNEWENEVSLDQEYLASVIDSYYGLWGAWKGDKGTPGSDKKGMWGMYSVKKRDDFSGKDDVVPDVIEQLFHPSIQYTAYLSDKLSGDFSLRFDSSKPYTNHSRYLKNITLNGSNNTRVILNSHNNIITGNKGVTTVVLQGSKSDYALQLHPETKRVLHAIGLGSYRAIDGYNSFHGDIKLEFLNK